MNWKSEVRLRDLIEQYNPDAEDELKEIERVIPLWVERLSQYGNLKQFIPALKRVKTESGFNKWMNSIYDYCDANAIWVSLES